MMSAPSTKYRLVTRSDFDGLACAVLLKEIDLIDDIQFVHPKDMQDGKVDISDRDITTNLPFVPGAYLAFDHHASETVRVPDAHQNYVIDPLAPSAARVVYNYFGGRDRFPTIAPEMMSAVDKADSAQFTIEEVLHPTGWTLLNFLMDARTGLGRFKDFRISNYQLMMELIDYCKNRFLIYALFPECNISIHLMWGLKQQNTVFATGKSIFNRTSKTDIGNLMLDYLGGGHANAGTCQIDHDAVEPVLQELIAQINTDG